MPAVTIATASAVGAAHRRRGTDSEDDVGWHTDPRRTVIAVADGHSDPRCIRADRGARFAVRAAAELADPDAPTAATDLLGAWRALVERDAHEDPLPSGSHDVPLAYGTTVIACWITTAGLRLLQIGDGVAVVATAGGATRPLPPDGHEGTTETNSLAAGSASVARIAVLPLTELPAVVCLSTDGVDAAYPDAGGLLHAVEQLRAIAVELGAASVAPRLDAWVGEAAAVSGDDATVAVAVVTAADDEGTR